MSCCCSLFSRRPDVKSDMRLNAKGSATLTVDARFVMELAWQQTFPTANVRSNVRRLGIAVSLANAVLPPRISAGSAPSANPKGSAA